MKVPLFLLVTLLSGVGLGLPASQQVGHPEFKHKVLHVVGDPVATKIETNSKIKFKKDQELDFDFSIKTNAKQMVKLSLNNIWELLIFPDTDVFIDNSLDRNYIQPDEIILSKGKIYLRSIYISSGDDFFIDFRLKTPMSDQAISSAKVVNTLFEYNPEGPSMSFCNREGSFDAVLFQHEEKIALKALEKVSFQGEFTKDSKNIAFDMLLGGRKIPKGKWNKITSCDFKWAQDLEIKIQNDLASLQKNKAEKIEKQKQEKKDKDNRYLCHSPYGQLSQCHWKKTKDGCQRARCNAEGKWMDLQLLSSSACEKTDSVSACDY